MLTQFDAPNIKHLPYAPSIGIEEMISQENKQQTTCIDEQLQGSSLTLTSLSPWPSLSRNKGMQ